MANQHTGPKAATGGRDRILHAAFRQFAERGYTGVSMQQIADAAGVTKATLYHHFTDKVDLFAEVMQHQFSQSQASLRDSVTSRPTLRDTLIGFGTILFSAERADLSRLLGDFHRHVDQPRQDAFWATYERPWTILEGAMADAIERGEIAPGDPGLIAKVCFSAFIGQMQLARFAADIPLPTPPLAEDITDLLLNGLRSREARV